MIDLTNGLDMTRAITEGFSFAGFNTVEEKMWLANRSAPTPEEKSIIDSGPFTQGVYDFSMMLGERVFNNRPLTFEFHLLEREYGYRKIDEAYFKNALMKSGIQPIYDTHDPGYYYLGKCVSVDVEDDHVYGRLVITIEFDCYPFMIALQEEGNDDWDSFDFELDYSQENSYYIPNGKMVNIDLMNVGSAGVTPKIVTDKPITVVNGNVTYQISAGTTEDEEFRIEIGNNPMSVTGNNATVQFLFYKELI